MTGRQRISDVEPDRTDDGASTAPRFETRAAAMAGTAQDDDWTKR